MKDRTVAQTIKEDMNLVEEVYAVSRVDQQSYLGISITQGPAGSDYWRVETEERWANGGSLS